MVPSSPLARRAGLAGLALLLAGPAAAQEPQRPVPQTVRDLAAICAIGPDSPDHTAASFFCRGYLLGVGQYHGATHPIGLGPPPIFCVPTPPPTLRSTGEGFVAWAAANPQHADEAAVDGLMRYAAATWPCPPEPRPARRGRTRP